MYSAQGLTLVLTTKVGVLIFVCSAHMTKETTPVHVTVEHASTKMDMTVLEVRYQLLQ